ncbi:MAG: C4-dicarboxylic acid transporter DauA [Pseudohongiellaceae bacterium]
MPHRSHLFSLRFAHALRESCVSEKYTRERFIKDLLAGITVGIIAIPLAMALAIASGVPPQFGLYTAIIAGFLIALSGGSRYSVSGPTAAFVVILYPIAQSYGLSGLLVATVLSGIILVAMALLRLGRLIQYIPESVVLGFTGGIAVVIVILQIKDLFGLPIAQMPEHFLDKILLLAEHAAQIHLPSVAVAALTLFVMILWPRLRSPVPAHLPAIALASVAALLFAQADMPVDTIGSRFSYLLPDGSSGQGIPPVLPHFEWPWLREGAGGAVAVWNWQAVQDILPAALAIAMLGAIESLLCAVVLDGMSGRRHSANSELLGQGIGNIVTPFFGGITATAAIARSAANFRAGAQSPVAAMIHALVVLLGLVALTRLLSYLPMSGMAALLVMVAWNMSEAPKAMHLLRTAPRSDIAVFITCFTLTVLFDMVIAISTGMVLAALLFMKEIADMTRVSDISENKRLVAEPVPEGWCVLKISGPLFFAAADRVFGEIAMMCEERRGIILYLDGVPILDAGGVSALEKLVAKCRATGTQLMLTDLPFQPLRTLAKAGVQPIAGVLTLFPTIREALEVATPTPAE